MAQPDLAARVRMNNKCIFIKSGGTLYTVRIDDDRSLTIGRQNFSKGEYMFLYNDRSRELLISYQAGEKKELKTLGPVEKTIDADKIIELLIAA